MEKDIQSEDDVKQKNSSWVNNLFNSIQEDNLDILPESVKEYRLCKENKSSLDVTQVSFFKVNQLAFDSEYPRKEAFENVIASLNDPNFNLVYILSGDKFGINLYVGVVKNLNNCINNANDSIQALDYGKILKNVFEGNFNGSQLSPVRSSIMTEILNGAELYKNNESEINAGMILGIPTSNKRNSDKDEDFQGMDRLINAMMGLEWRIIIVCEPVPKKEILTLQNNTYELFNELSLISKFNISTTNTEGITNSDGQTSTQSSQKTVGTNRSSTNSFGYTYGSSTTTSVNKTYGFNKGESNSSNESYQREKNSFSNGKSSTQGNSESTSVGTTNTKSHSYSRNYSSSVGSSESSSTGQSIGINKSISSNKGTSNAISLELANKHAQDIMKYIDEELLARIKQGLNKGLFKTSVYYVAKEPAHAERLKSGLRSLFQGNIATHCPLVAFKLNNNYKDIHSWLQSYQNHYIETEFLNEDASILLSRPQYQNLTGLCTYLTASEISLLAGLPQTEVPGLALKEIVDFGLNESISKKDDEIELGCMVQRGRKLDNIIFKLSKNSLSKHIFIAGVTGSGKTTTCQKLLSESKVPFLVIEPAKTEYRSLILNENFNDVVVFTLGNESVAPFRINPFELIPGEVISSHIDMLKATFTSAFPMEASMPQILEEAIYKCYELKGWNIDTNLNEIHGEHAYDKDIDSFPILSELLKVLEQIVDEKNFSTELSANYKGSLISRLSNLTVGSKGAMLNCSHSTDFEYISEHNVIIEMEDIKSPEDKSLLMGFVLSRLSAVIKSKHKNKESYSHLTLIEEAHRLLSKIEYGDSGAKKGAIETFTDMLAEVRKYGEGLIVVDQIPNKLATEVIKNTNTKIIHKILAKDDKETVGDTMLMNEKQKEYLSALETGNAIVFNEHTNKPVHICIKTISNTNEQDISEDLVHKRFKEKLFELGSCYDFHGLQPIFRLFSEVCSKLNDEKEYEVCRNGCFKQLKDFISEYSQKSGKNHMEIWNALIKRYVLVTGKSIYNYRDQTNLQERLNEFLELFSVSFEKDSFSYNDLKKNYVNLISYQWIN